jgi:hypothetical protein
LEIVGDPPGLDGLLREAFICEGFVYKGEVVVTANTVHLCFAGTWHRLNIDAGVIIWRQSAKAPAPWAVPEQGWESRTWTSAWQLVSLATVSSAMT